MEVDYAPDNGGAAAVAAPAAAAAPVPALDLGLYAPAGELGHGSYGRVEVWAVPPGSDVPPGTPRTIAVKWVQVQVCLCVSHASLLPLHSLPHTKSRVLRCGGQAGELEQPRSKVRREIENAMALPDHPNICKTYGCVCVCVRVCVCVCVCE